MVGDTTPFVFVRTPYEERDARFSPDGRFVAYTSNESGRYEVYVRTFAPPVPGSTVAPAGRQLQASTNGGMYPVWRADGQELYFIGPEGQLIATPVQTRGDTFDVGTPATLFQTHIYGGGAELSQDREYDVSRDGRFLINTVLDDPAAPITLLQNWNPESKP